MVVTNEQRMAIEGRCRLCVAQPSRRIRCPADVGVFKSVEPTVDYRHLSRVFAEILLVAVVAYVEVTVDEYSSVTRGTPQWFRRIEIEIAMRINGVTVEGVVGTLEVTVRIVGIFAADNWAEVQSAYKSAVVRLCPFTVTES